MKKALVFGIALLLIGVTVAPSLFADVKTVSKQDELTSSDTNYNCFIIGRTTQTNFFLSDETETVLSEFIEKVIWPLLESINSDKIIIQIIEWLIAITFLMRYFNNIGIMQFNSTIMYGRSEQSTNEPEENFYSKGWVWTSGENGIVKFDGGRGKLGVKEKNFGVYPDNMVITYYIGVKNFTGIRTFSPMIIDGKLYGATNYIGTASEVSIG